MWVAMKEARQEDLEREREREGGRGRERMRLDSIDRTDRRDIDR